MAASHDFGRRGEACAAEFLRARGWRILERNFRFGHREIDIVARRATTVAFVEVKSRADTRQAHPLEAIDGRKRREIARVARAWVARHGRPGDVYRFDAVSVLQGAGPDAPLLVAHVADAWRLE